MDEVEVQCLSRQLPQHDPRHDIESVFWVHVCGLVRALLDGADLHPTEHSNCVINNMLQLSLTENGVPPSGNTCAVVGQGVAGHEPEVVCACLCIPIQRFSQGHPEE